MKNTKPIQTYASQNDVELINEAAQRIGLSASAFIRSSSVKEARQILKEASS